MKAGKELEHLKAVSRMREERMEDRQLKLRFR
jgi:hypothetical protein